MKQERLFENRFPVRPRKKWDSIEQYVEFLRHFTAYKYVKKFVKGRSLLEIGCGKGYSANYLSQLASNLTAVDVSKKCITHCHTKYKKGKLTFLHASGLSIPLEDGSIDVALSFQATEYIEPKKV